MLTLNSSEDNNCFKFIGCDNQSKSVHLISNNTSLIAPTLSGQISLLSSDNNEDTCSFYSGPSDETIVAFGESRGSIAYDSSESCGSIAYSGSESCGSIASTSSFSGGSSLGGSCSYSC